MSTDDDKVRLVMHLPFQTTASTTLARHEADQVLQLWRDVRSGVLPGTTHISGSEPVMHIDLAQVHLSEERPAKEGT